jgi:hypothetical protein
MKIYQRCLVVVLVILINSWIYDTLNQHPLWPPSPWPQSPFDPILEFQTWAIWPYACLLLLGPFCLLWVRQKSTWIWGLRAYTISFGLNVCFWFGAPSTLPRLPQDLGSGLTASLWRLLLQNDAPNNCFPSGHLTIPIVAVAILGLEKPHLRWPLLGLIALLTPSVWTTGQHYLVDVLAGITTALCGLAWAHWGPATTHQAPRGRPSP